MMLDIREVLRKENIDAELISLDVPMKTAQAAADELGISVAQIFKSLVIKGVDESQIAVVILDGEARINLKTVTKLLGWKKARFAPNDLVLTATGYPAGGTPPVAHKRKLPVIVDENIKSYKYGYGGGGRPELLLRITPDEVIRATSAIVANVRQS